MPNVREKEREKKSGRRRPPRFELTGGMVCLDFINTLDDRFNSEPKELLNHYVDLARFGEDSGILSPAETDHLFELSYASPEPAQRALNAGIQLREAMHQVFWAVVNRRPAPKGALFTLNQYVQVAAQHAVLAPVGEHFEWRFEDAPNNFERPLWAIARSAAELLGSEQLQFVKACASATCQWLFLDSSKNHRRRWCDMKLCGNREKFRSFYRRQKKGLPSHRTTSHARKR